MVTDEALPFNVEVIFVTFNVAVVASYNNPASVFADKLPVALSNNDIKQVESVVSATVIVDEFDAEFAFPSKSALIIPFVPENVLLESVASVKNANLPSLSS